MALSGSENDVLWAWNNSLHIMVGGIHVPPHELHGKSVASLGGNTFYGGFSIVSSSHKLYTSGIFKANPTKTQHTEPQYFEWLVNELDDVPLSFRNPNAFILEMNQTNTPCSGKSCRPFINKVVEQSNLCGNAKITVARMSAYQIYESQYPKVVPTSFERAAGVKLSTTTQHPISQSMCLHRFTEI